MRFIFYVLLAMVLAACASAPRDAAQGASGTALATAGAPPKVPVDALTVAPGTIDVDRNSVQALGHTDQDIWTRIRAGFQIPDLASDQVQMQIDWYAQRPAYVQRMTDRSKRYLYHIVEELEARHMPTELALLPFIESAYNPQALSVARAAGMWQFVPGTGKDYNLRQNMFRDERRDVLASTSAALDYLSRLHDMFGDWYLALAAYNWGEGNVQRAIARNTAAGLPTDYESLRMPAETRHYVPKLQAVKDIVANPAAYGLELAAIPNHPYFVTVTTAHDIDVDVAARLSGLTLDEFKALNPSFTRPVILGATQPQILLPFDNAQAFEQGLKTTTQPLSRWTTYTVKQRETPVALSRRIGVDSTVLMSVNRIPVGMRLRPGSTVLVPRSGAADDDEDISADVAENAVLAMEPDIPDTRKMLVRTRRRQSMAMIAARYGVSLAQLQKWNKTQRGTVAAGQRLVLHVPVGKAMPVEPGPLRPVMAAGGFQRVSFQPGRARSSRIAVRMDGRTTGKPVPNRINKADVQLRGRDAKPGIGSVKKRRTEVKLANLNQTSQARPPAPVTKAKASTSSRQKVLAEVGKRKEK